jgi:hypothetical protein
VEARGGGAGWSERRGMGRGGGGGGGASAAGGGEARRRGRRRGAEEEERRGRHFGPWYSAGYGMCGFLMLPEVKTTSERQTD